MIESFIQLADGSRQQLKQGSKNYITDLLPKRAAEDVFQLWIWDLGKKLFVSTDDNSQYGKNGLVKITDSWELKDVRFRVELVQRPCVRLTFEHKKTQQAQTVYLDSIRITFGVKRYFLCPRCSKRVAILYLRHDCYQFACFNCSHLFYRNTRLNRKTNLGYMFRHMYAIGKLKLKQQRLNQRYSYAGKPTKRCVSWLKSYAKVAVQYDPQFQYQKA